VLKKSDIRGFVDDRNEKIGKKIRDAEIQKVPYMIIIGEQEQTDEILSVRRHGKGDLGKFTSDEFVKLVNEEIENS
jgi:threonyl-tRNA synthetase